jgi:hypothetical protein
MRLRSMSILVALVVAAMPSVAQAAPPVEHFHVEDVRTGSASDCGFIVDFEITESLHVMLREAKGSDGQALLQHLNYFFEAVVTNPETEAWMLIRRHGLTKDVTAVHVGGNIWEFTAHEVGQPFVVENSEGKVVFRDRGLVTFTYRFDTLGDSQPGGDIVEGSMQVTSVHGPHPAGDPLVEEIPSPEFCAIETELIG